MREETRQRLIAEALRLNDRFLHEVIERRSFCPYARNARRDGAMKRHVWLEPLEPTGPLLELMASIAADPAQEVVQVIFPRVELDAWAWRTYVKRLDDELAQGSLARFKAILASAAFHPRSEFDTRTPATLVPLFRRAPDPTIQWTRLDVLEAVSKSAGETPHYIDVRGVDLDALLEMLKTQRPPLAERIAAANYRCAHALGVDALVAHLAELAEDGRRAYARILAEDDPGP